MSIEPAGPAVAIMLTDEHFGASPVPMAGGLGGSNRTPTVAWFSDLVDCLR